MKGKDLYDLYCEVHAESQTAQQVTDDLNRIVGPRDTALAWPYLTQNEKDIWDQVGSRLGERRVRQSR